jgi:hypothetical protein
MLRHDLAFQHRPGTFLAYLDEADEVAMFDLDGVLVQAVLDRDHDPFCDAWIPLEHRVRRESAYEVARALRLYANDAAWALACAQVAADRQATGLRYPYAFGAAAESSADDEQHDDRPHCAGCTLCLGVPNASGF